jgi:hypothetical protein
MVRRNYGPGAHPHAGCVMVDKVVFGGDTELEPMRLLVVNAGSSSVSCACWILTTSC